MNNMYGNMLSFVRPSQLLRIWSYVRTTPVVRYTVRDGDKADQGTDTTAHVRFVMELHVQMHVFQQIVVSPSRRSSASLALALMMGSVWVFVAWFDYQLNDDLVHWV